MQTKTEARTEARTAVTSGNGFAPPVTVAREYVRVSADKSDRMASPDQQHAGNAQAAADHGWHFGDPYAERDAVSASMFSRKVRPGWDALLADLATGQFGPPGSVLVLWEASRGSRRVGEWAGLLDVLAAAQVQVYVTKDRRLSDPAVPRDRKSLLEDALDSEYESAKIRDRVTRASEARAAQGMPHGSIPYGFTRAWHVLPSGRRELASQDPDPASAPVVVEIYQRVAGGHSLRSIARDLNARAVPSPAAVRAARNGQPAPAGARWTADRIRDLCLSASYAGRRVRNPAGRRTGHPAAVPAFETAAAWPALVSDDLWERTRRMLRNPRRTTRRPGRDRWLASLIAVCATCGGPLTVRNRRGRWDYTCRNHGCTSIPVSSLDPFVTALVMARLSDPEVWARLAGADPADVRAAADTLAVAQGKLDDLRAALADGSIDLDDFKAGAPGRKAAVAKAQTTLDRLQRPADLADTLNGADPWNLPERWESAPVTARRRVLRLLFAEGGLAVSPAGRGRRMDAVPVSERVSVRWR